MKLTRREFSVAAAATMALPAFGNQDPDPIRIGLVGCGGRGTGAAENCITSSKNVKLVAMGDLFEDRLKGSRKYLESKGWKVDDEKCFTGFDAYKKVLETDIDLVILATPPGFRPMMFEAAIEAGKNVFFEKPVAVDPAGVRKVIAAAAKAREKSLGVVAGTQRRHQKSYLETIQRIHDGAIGEVVAARCYWNQGGLWHKERRKGQSDIEWQIRNWLYFCWLSGDHIVEQHIHNIDVINWVMKDHPVQAVGMGGRIVRTDDVYGNIFDHFAIDYTYPSGAHMMSMSRQQAGTDGAVGEAVVGTKGFADPRSWIKGDEEWKFKGRGRNPYVQEHADLIDSIRAGKPLNEAKRVAESTLTAIMGREAAYTGKTIKWDEFLNSDLDLAPDTIAFGDREMRPVPRPGRKR